MTAVRNGSPKLGIHTLPYCAEMSEMNQPEVQEKFNKGPVAILTVFPNGLPNMGKLMPQQIGFFLLLKTFVESTTTLFDSGTGL